MEDPVHRKIAELLLPCSLEIADLKHSVDLAATRFRQELEIIRSKLQETITERENVAGLRNSLMEMEGLLEKALSVKVSNEAKHKNASKSLMTAKARTTELKKSFTGQAIRKDEYASIISQQLIALKTLEDQYSQKNDERQNLQDTIQWYYKVLGFKTTGGTGVKFTFTRIDHKNPEKEFSFTVKLQGDIYNLVQCDLNFDHLSDLVEELNQTNDLFKFVRIMRQKFAASVLSDANGLGQGLSTTILTSPPSSIDSRSELLSVKNNISNYQLDGQYSPASASGSSVVGSSSELKLSKRREPHLVSKSPKSVSAPQRPQRCSGRLK